MAAEEKKLTFEKGLKELESIVERLEGEGLSLEQSLALFEQGVALSKGCRKQLQDAETKVEILLKEGDGQVEAKPFNLQEAGGNDEGPPAVPSEEAPF